MLCPVREGGRDDSGEGALDGEPDVGKWFNQDLMVDGKRKSFFFWPDMLVASKCSYR